MIIERIDELIKSLKIKQKDFADFINISQGTLATAKSRKSELSEPVIAAILASYPNLNYRWLIFGEGEMWLESKKHTPLFTQETQLPYNTLNPNQGKKEDTDVLVLRERLRGMEQENESLKRENALLREMVDMLKKNK